jgi:hypothetical protein
MGEPKIRDAVERMTGQWSRWFGGKLAMITLVERPWTICRGTSRLRSKPCWVIGFLATTDGGMRDGGGIAGVE